jgi:hypothetical protein
MFFIRIRLTAFYIDYCGCIFWEGCATKFSQKLCSRCKPWNWGPQTHCVASRQKRTEFSHLINNLKFCDWKEKIIICRLLLKEIYIVIKCHARVSLHKTQPLFEVFLKWMVEKRLEPFPCLTARFYGYYDTSTVGLYSESLKLLMKKYYCSSLTWRWEEYCYKPKSASINKFVRHTEK